MESFDNSVFIKNIAKIRERYKMNQEEFTDWIGVCRQSVSLWEKGKARPDIKSIRLLCNKLNLTYSELVLEELLDDKFEKPLAKVDEYNIVDTTNDNSCKHEPKKNNIKNIVMGIVWSVLSLAMLAVTIYIAIIIFLPLDSNNQNYYVIISFRYSWRVVLVYCLNLIALTIWTIVGIKYIIKHKK